MEKRFMDVIIRCQPKIPDRQFCSRFWVHYPRTTLLILEKLGHRRKEQSTASPNAFVAAEVGTPQLKSYLSPCPRTRDVLQT
jgi:hypothetical protein